MGKTESNASTIGTAAAADNTAADAAQQPQLTFFDTVTPPTMTTENSSPAEHVQPEANCSADASPAPDEMPMEQETAPLAAEAADRECAPEPAVHVGESLGQRLRAAREARGLRIDEAAQRMKLPLGTVQALEADRYDRIGEGIYLRSYLTKYLRLLDLPLVLAERVLTQAVEPPPLFTSGTISRPRYLFERYSSSALYLILTAVIIVPAVWLAMRAGFDAGVVQITPLDGPSPALPVAQTQAGASPAAEGNTSATASPEHGDETPLVASLAPFPPMKHDTAEVAEKPAAKPIADTAASGEHTLRLTLPEASWVEIVAADGEKLEYGLLPAGTVRSYHSAKAIDVRLGNSSGATVEIDGKPADLAPFRRSNVAHFRLSGGEASASHSGG